MKTNYSLLFYLKKPKHYTSGPVPIYLRLTVAGKRAETAAGREIDPARWNSKIGRGSGSKENTKTLNAYLDTLLAKVQQAHQSLISSGKAITAENLRNAFGGKAEKQCLLMEVPLLPAAQHILSRYQDHPQCENTGLLLPVLSNQKMNAYLNEIADLCGIPFHPPLCYFYTKTLIFCIRKESKSNILL